MLVETKYDEILTLQDTEQKGFILTIKARGQGQFAHPE